MVLDLSQPVVDLLEIMHQLLRCINIALRSAGTCMGKHGAGILIGTVCDGPRVLHEHFIKKTKYCMYLPCQPQLPM